MGTPRLGRLLFVLLLVATNVLLFRAFVRWGETPTAVAGFLYPYELQAYDALLQTYGSQAAIHPRLRVIGVDDSSLEVFGPWPWNRAIHAQLVDRLREGGASVGAFDFIFESQAEGTEPFAASLASFKHGVLANTLPSAATSEGKGAGHHLIRQEGLEPLPVLAKAAAGVGFIDADHSDDDYDPKIRRVQLAAMRDGRWRYAWDLVTFAQAQGVAVSEITVEPNGIRVGSTFIPTNAEHQILINYLQERSTADVEVDPLQDIPYWRMLGAPPPKGYVGTTLPLTPDLVKDGVFLAGVWETTVLGDMVETPVGRKFGVWVHAQIVNTLLNGRFVRESPFWVDVLLLLALPLLLAYAFERIHGVAVLLLAFGVIGGLAGLAVALFGHGWWIRVLGPCVAVFVTALLVVIHQFVRSHMLLRQFITPELAHDLLLAAGENAHTTEEDCTVIFSDIRGFTTLNEQMPPSKMVALLKEYHSLTVPIYERHGGRCLDYLGDAQMVVYGDPMTRKRAPEKNHAVAALKAALEVHAAIEAMNERWEKRGDPAFDVGIGACSGIVAIGVLGADTAHLQYTVIGDVTNTAARVQGLSRDLSAPVICTESTVQRAGGAVVAERIKAVSLKGKRCDVIVYRVLGVANDAAGVARMRAQTQGGETSLAEPTAPSPPRG